MEKLNFSLQANNQTAVSKVHNEIITARKSPLFESFSESDKMAGMLNMLKTAYLDSGKAINGQDDEERLQHLTAISIRLISIIPEKFKGITGAELRIAFRNGAIGSYGEVYTISPKTIIEWIQAYIDERGKYTLKEPVKQITETIEPTPEEWRNIMANKLMKCYKEVADGKEPTDYGNVLFKFLREKSLIELTQDDIDNYIEQAKTVIISKNDPLDAKSLADRVDRRNLIKLITEQSKTTQVIIEARNIALREYLMFVDDIEELRKTILNAI